MKLNKNQNFTKELRIKIKNQKTTCEDKTNWGATFESLEC